MKVFDEKRRLTYYKPCNIYDTAVFGVNCKVGMFAEVGNHVVVGSNTSIGKGAFLCEGVIIGTNVFIGPHVCFSNDMYPPSSKENWLQTIVEDNVSIGAGVVIRPGVTIGKGATIGCGSVVTRNIPAGETWVGNPASKLKRIK